MDLDYLKAVLEVRKQEIEDGKNLHTAQPIYVVLDLQEIFYSEHSEYSSITNLKNKEQEFGFIDNAVEWECREFSDSESGMEKPEPVKKFI